MALEEPQPVPLHTTEDGTIRVGGTRVSLDSVIAAYWEGATPEEIVVQYDSLKAGDVYSVIGYYLHHREEIDAYLQRQRAEASELRREIEARCPATGLKERLLARRKSDG